MAENSFTFDDYKLMEQDPSKFTLMHPDGSSFDVAKSGLDNDMIHKISGLEQASDPNSTPMPDVPRETASQKFQLDPSLLPKQQSFGETMSGVKDAFSNLTGVKTLGPSDTDIAPVNQFLNEGDRQSYIQAYKAKHPEYAGDASGTAQPLTPAAGAQTASEVLPQNQLKATPTPATSPVPGGDLQGQMNKAYGLEAQGLKEAAEAKGAKGRAEADIYGQLAPKLEQLQKETETKFQDLNKEHETLYYNVLNDKVDPTHYWQDKSVGNKISAAIAIGAGALGKALIGGENPALAIISKSIDRDIESQRTNIDKNRGLLADNLARTKNLMDAELMTKNSLLAVAAAQVSKAEAASTDPMAKAEYKTMLGQLKMTVMQNNMELAKRSAMLQIAQGSPGRINPEMLGKDDRERLVQLPNGMQKLAYSAEAAKDSRERLSTAAPIMNSLDALDKLGASALVPNSPESQKADALRATLVPLVNEFSKINRLTPEDEKIVMTALKDPTSFRQILGGSERSNVLRRVISDRLESILSQNLEGYQPAFKPKSFQPIAKR